MICLSKCTAPSLAFVLIFGCNGCGSKTVAVTAPPSIAVTATPAQYAYLWGGIGSGTILFYRWNDELAVMICIDVQGATQMHGNASGPPSVRRSEGSVTAEDGRKFEWLLEGKEGQEIECRVNDKAFDLKKGNLILVKTKSSKTEIEQISQDFSAVKPDFETVIESVTDFARKNPAINKFIEIGDE